MINNRCEIAITTTNTANIVIANEGGKYANNLQRFDELKIAVGNPRRILKISNSAPATSNSPVMLKKTRKTKTRKQNATKPKQKQEGHEGQIKEQKKKEEGRREHERKRGEKIDAT